MAFRRNGRAEVKSSAEGEAIFARYGPLTVGFARFFSVLRQLNGVVAGSLEMDWRRFLVFNALGGALWVIVWTMAGFYLGKHGSEFAAVIHKLGLFGAIFVLITLTAFLIWLFVYRIIWKSRGEAAGKSKNQ